ncbi:uncharacterized protein LOC129612212 isoform X2 [Condylostylus longicornis]|uniref:uncharacterized protein LOC129612212 isoform X2 n=1 Tax=Condylostylus longicornis TaxID=2530218 RepID=UPI00244E03C6|nr:uncharacterized protein LOC129612212 isoform X2 [Condylostylus longicornis]
MSISFTINSKPYTIELKDYPVDITLNEFIRQHAGLTGTKFMCLEAGCGACICVLKGPHPATRNIRTYATNSCLTLLNTIDGLDVITIEGIGNRNIGYHPIQERLAQTNGTQCGYCSPAMVMNMYGLIESIGNDNITMEMIENSFGGNICRCTGYRTILDAMKSFAKDYDLCKNNIDIEDSYKIKNICSKTGLQCTQNGKCYKRNEMKFIEYDRANDDAKWYLAKNYDDIFKAFDDITNNEKYMLVAGNTGHGVYRRPDDIKIFIDLNKIMDLHSSEIKENEIRLGACVNLTEAMDIFNKASKQKNFEYCSVLWKHFDIIANVPVRNMGTLGGNLMMKNANNEFPSDIFLTFEALNAQVIILEDPVKTQTMSVLDFIKTDMRKKILKELVLPGYSANEFSFNSYKIMPRAQNAHAYVNGSFLIQYDNKPPATNKIVKSARICFGGITENFVHAKNTEEFLNGKDLSDAKVIKETMKILKNELKPDWILPDASPEYRQLLACGLFYKCILSNVPTAKMNPLYKTGSEILHRPLSSGKQTYETIEKNYPLTKAIPKIEALVQCAGEAFYMNDLPLRKDELYCAFVFATKADSKVVGIDASDALKLDGVEAFYSAKDIPGVNNFIDSETMPFLFPDAEEIFCSSVVAYFSQPVGVIAASSTKLAEKAAKLVKVIYEKVSNKKVLPTMKDVFKNAANERIVDCLSIGEETSLSGTDFNKNKKITGYLDIDSQYHYTMEPQTTVCIPIEDGMEVYCASQWMDLTQVVIAKALNVQQNSIKMQVRRVGGGYGAKISRSCQVAAACALVAHKLNRPTRFIQTIESMMSCMGKRYSCHSDYEVEFNDAGKILALKNIFYEDGGCTANENPIPILSIACTKNCYQVDKNWKIDGKVVKTDAPSTTWCRGPGAIEGIAMIETIIEHIAFETNKDPVDVRLENLTKTEKMAKLLPEFLKSTEYKQRKNDIEKFNKENRWRKKGLGIAIMKYPIEYFGNINATVSVFHSDGTVAISHGCIEMGQGVNTKVVQVAAFTLGIPIEKIKIEPSSTFTSPNNVVTGGGVGSESACLATQRACETILERLKPIKDTMKNSTWEELIHAAQLKNIDLTASGIFKPGDLKDYDVWGISLSEVEIDILTGNVLVNRVDILEDTGESLSPLIDIGQIEGAFIMGLGYWLTELLVVNRETGELLTTRTWNYKPPGVKDIPVDFRINLVQKSPNPAGFLRSKTTGEPAIALSVSIVFAIRHALDSARKDAGIEKKWYHLGAPTTPEIIMLNAGTSTEMFEL